MKKIKKIVVDDRQEEWKKSQQFLELLAKFSF